MQKEGIRKEDQLPVGRAGEGEERQVLTLLDMGMKEGPWRRKGYKSTTVYIAYPLPRREQQREKVMLSNVDNIHRKISSLHLHLMKEVGDISLEFRILLAIIGQNSK